MTTENEKPENDENEDESTEVDEAALLDAISDAVDEVTPDDVLEANDERTDDEKAADAAAVEADEAAAAAEAAKTPEEKAADEAAAAAKLDPINDPIPESTNEKTATRIKSLIEIAKGTTQAASERDEILQAVQDTGADPDQYANTLGFLTLYNSEKPADRQQALAVAEGMVRELQIDLGVGTVDLLDKHDDLKAEVEAGTLTQDRAVEIATGREQTVLNTARTEAADTKSAQAEHTAKLITAGKAQLNTLETTLKGDADFARLRPVFLSVLQASLRDIHPQQWSAVAQEIYQKLKTANPAPIVDDGKPLPKIPLRPNSGNSGASSTELEGEPGTALDALGAAIDSM